MAELTLAEGRWRAARSPGAVGALPNFLIIGAAKSGTTSLHYYLRQHPEIFMCPRKDTFFFNFDGQEPDYRGPGDEALFQSRAVIRPNAYQALFAEASSNKAVGEACAQYLYDPEAAGRIHRHLPDAKLIAVLRDPVERAYSSFLQQVRDGHETTDDFAEALALEDERSRHRWRPIWHYAKSGFYFQQIKRYLRLFDPSQIRLFLYEDLQENPVGLLQDIFAFLGVDVGFEPDVSIQHNRAGIPTSRLLHKLIMNPNKLKSVVKPLLPGRLRRVVKAAVTESEVHLRRPGLPAELRRRLADGYREDVLKLQDLIRRDLSPWLS